ncbi:hypothetical protein BCR36DRAFT_373533 [Piromyces finnis]|uniref:Uncharacterized protein n=1 Tax=Piromyces finnis TaxID=1754191 RepID=A0A1Y1V1P6_9FUNG|nr:hypothetical protein BCR36DRAFT_373533 [Piromyces finnis]|eukprot:ORX44051.1 hypothetical protein BCR36DRAFT_373533 [Piromyces finnis]
MFSKLGLNEPKSNDKKFNFFYKLLPTDVIIFSSIIICQNNWDKCKKHMEITVLRLQFLKVLNNQQYKNKNVGYSTETNNVTKGSRTNKKRHICYRSGHIAKDCWKNKKNIK